MRHRHSAPFTQQHEHQRIRVGTRECAPIQVHGATFNFKFKLKFYFNILHMSAVRLPS